MKINRERQTGLLENIRQIENKSWQTPQRILDKMNIIHDTNTDNNPPLYIDQFGTKKYAFFKTFLQSLLSKSIFPALHFNILNIVEAVRIWKSRWGLIFSNISYFPKCLLALNFHKHRLLAIENQIVGEMGGKKWANTRQEQTHIWMCVSRVNRGQCFPS